MDMGATPEMQARRVPCPFCEAVAGTPCVNTVNGSVRDEVHMVRWLRARTVPATYNPRSPS